MKKKLLIISSSALLLASSGISSQTQDKQDPVLADAHTSPDTDLKSSAINNASSKLVLAKASIDHVIPELDKPVLDNSVAETLADQAAEPIQAKQKSRLETGIEDTNAETATPPPAEAEAKAETPAAEAPAKYFSDEEIAQLRQLFLQAESALKKKNNDEYQLLAEQLTDYPLYPYLQYKWLKKHLGKKGQVTSFLEQNKSSRYAKILKHRWLHHLARKKQWSTFLQHYSKTSNTKLNCYYHTAQYHTGNKQQAMEGARKLWSVGFSQPKQCDPLFKQLKQSKLFTQELLWQRFDAALRNKKVKLATFIKKMMSNEHHATAQLWINLHRNPARYMPKFLSSTHSSQSPLMFSHAVDRLARTDITAAIKTWDANKQNFKVEKQRADKLEKRLAFKLAYKKDSAAYERFSKLDATDNSSRTWRIRVALLEQNWPNVITAIQDLHEDEKQQEKWQYWLARAYLETNKTELAESILTELSSERSFYGYLAADKVNSIYQLSDKPVDVTTAEISGLKNRKEFSVAFELMALDRTKEAKLQWWHAIRPLNKKDILVAAKLAQQWQWDEVAIFTIAKAKYWDDIDVRFPLSYKEKIHENSAQNNLDPVIIYGLIRRESAFNEKATSPTGARGLMQIMPGTGKSIARNLKERWRGKNSLYDPITNLRYGSYYYQSLLDRFNGHYALALAAYNAGPHRVKKWLPEAETMPADIWIETIPFHETRDYVTTVLAYALIYQQRTNSTNLSMNDFTQDVQPAQ